MRELLDRARTYVTAIMRSYSRHAGSQLSAAIAYRVLFSLVPFAALLLTILDVVLPPSRREQFVNWLFGVFPGTDLQRSIDNTLAASSATAPIVGVVALATLLWAASGMMASIRIAFRVIWDREQGPTYVRSKLRDFALVGLAGILVVSAFALSVIVRIVVETGADLSDAVGWTGGATVFSTLADVASSTLVVFAALLALYRFVPPVRTPVVLLWPSALAASLAFELTVYGYAVYATRFASFNTIYGPIGAVLAFLVLVYLLAAIVLLGAETAAARRPRAS
ncbi:MAG TPA: YihY/virulence factor BrkB family protein [Gaiellaceae bacterium]|nr:YihY/virulence factor BrkB family protein [Gaiellaceae bacterium]